MRTLRLVGLALGSLGVGSCGHGTAFAPAPGAAPLAVSRPARVFRSPIQHVVIVIQENRTFNDFFATFPSADGTTTGKIAADKACQITHDETIPLLKSNLVIYPLDLNHLYQGYRTAYDHGGMDGFDHVLHVTQKSPECTFPYQYTNPKQIEPYWDMAKQYTLAEHMFTTHGSSSFVAHQDLIRGNTQIAPNESLINDPFGQPWGCNAPRGSRTHLITSGGHYEGQRAGPFPCTNHFPQPSAYTTLRDLLDAKRVSWKYYTPLAANFGKLLTAYRVIAPVFYGPEWRTNIISPQTTIYSDVKQQQLAEVSWVIPDEPDSDHPGESVDTGPAWVASIVNAIGKSPYWGSTAIVIVWDDWGGLYDNIAPPQHAFGGLGFRVPAIIVSPYARPHYISTTNYEFGSILRYIENNWKLGTLGTTDATATSIRNVFDYAQPPIPFKHIRAQHTQAYFIHRKPSYLPIDDDM